jgi:hypothetical protein
MQRQVVRLTRQELCEKMWSRPAISLAEEFGISGQRPGQDLQSLRDSRPSARLLHKTRGWKARDQDSASNRKIRRPFRNFDSAVAGGPGKRSDTNLNRSSH